VFVAFVARYLNVMNFKKRVCPKCPTGDICWKRYTHTGEHAWKIPYKKAYVLFLERGKLPHTKCHGITTGFVTQAGKKTTQFTHKNNTTTYYQ